MEGRRGARLWGVVEVVAVLVVLVGGGQPRTVPATDFRLQNLGPHLFTQKKTERQTVRKGRGGGVRRRRRREAGEEGRKRKNKPRTKECVIKTGNGRREEDSGGFQTETGRGRFSREPRSGADTRAV